MRLRSGLIFAAFLVVALAQGQATEEKKAPSPPAGVAPVAKKTLPVSAYDIWETPSGSQLSADGRWFAHGIFRPNGENRLIIRSSDGPERWEVKYGMGPQMSDNSQWVAYRTGFSRAAQEQAAQQRRRLEYPLTLKKLSDGTDTVFKDVASFSFTKGSGFLVLRMPRQGGPGDLAVVDLSDLSVTTFGSIANHVVDREGKRIAWITTNGAREEGVQVLDLATMAVRQVRWNKGAVKGLTFSRDGQTLSYMEGNPNEKKEGDDHRVIVATSLDQAKPKVRVIERSQLSAIPATHRISEFGGLRLSPDGSVLVFGSRFWKDRVTDQTPENQKSTVEIWHGKDTDVVPLQRNTGPAAANATAMIAVRLSDLANAYVSDPETTVAWNEALTRAYVTDPRKHETSVKKGGLEHSDVTAVDIFANKRTPVIVRGINNVFGLEVGSLATSPDGRYAMYFKDRHWNLFDITTGQTKNITKGAGEFFENELYDGPVPHPVADASPVFWEASDGFFLQSTYDVFSYAFADGTLKRVTSGRKDNWMYTPINMGFGERGLLRSGDPLYMRMFNQQTKQQGIARREADGTVKTLISDAKGIRFNGKSKNTDRVLMTIESPSQPPTVYLTNLDFTAAKPMTRTNEQFANTPWGKVELLQYRTSWGVPLQGTLIYPADYVPGKKYPMVTIIYERMSDGTWNFETPGYQQQYSVQHFSQNGYFVLMPDIAYRTNYPGPSAVECIETAVRTALAKNKDIDKDKIGLTGHSWGGYQTAYVAGRSKMFAAYMAGAPLIEYTTMYNSFYWNWGETNQVIFENSQGRMNIPWFENERLYRENSPLVFAENINKPFMLMHGDKDGAVDFTQSQFMYNTLRRMGKDVILLVYLGENHNPVQEANVKDFSRRVWHFFDVHLKGAPAEKWLKDGVRLIEIDSERRPPKPEEPEKKEPASPR